jgi:hypothetical protein
MSLGSRSGVPLEYNGIMHDPTPYQRGLHNCCNTISPLQGLTKGINPIGSDSQRDGLTV